MTWGVLRRLVLVALVLAAVIAIAPNSSIVFDDRRHFAAELPDAAGIRAEDEVRVAGVVVGEVSGIAARGDRVVVEFDLDHDVSITADTQTEVKLATLLGKRYLNLEPGKGTPVDSGGTLRLANAHGTYTVERFWIDSGESIQKLDPSTLSDAVDVLAKDLQGSPQANREALDGLTSLSQTVVKRDEQIERLLAATRSVTDEAVAQRADLVQLLKRGDKVFRMVEDRKEAIDLLLKDSRALVHELTSMARQTKVPMEQALRDLQSILDVLVAHRDDLARTLQIADPALRLYVNSAGDGPWLGVNAPYVIFPDNFWCVRKDIGC